jgi:hypothetical protein
VAVPALNFRAAVVESGEKEWTPKGEQWGEEMLMKNGTAQGLGLIGKNPNENGWTQLLPLLLANRSSLAGKE